MKLFNFPGLNCYYGSVVSGANAFGVPFVDAFANLFSETDFDYNPCSKSFSSRRLLANLDHLGTHSEVFACKTPKEGRNSFLEWGEDVYFVIGMDPIHIHWTPSFGRFNGYHYFLAKPVGGKGFLCYDPTYGNQKEPMPQEVIVTHAFDMTRLHRSQKNALEIEDLAELSGVLEGKPLSFWQLFSVGETENQTPSDGIFPGEKGQSIGRKAAEKAAWYVDCLIHSRLLYWHYLKYRKPFLLTEFGIFNDGYLNRWLAVKNGLLTASVRRDNAVVLEETWELFEDLIRREREAAKAVCEKNGKNMS